jgi:hypothetical protein
LCVVNCGKLKYTTGEVNKDGSCKCLSKYYWDTTTKQCIASSGSSKVALGLGLGIPLGLLGLAGLIALGYFLCCAPTAGVIGPPVMFASMPPIMTPVSAIAPMAVTTTTKTVPMATATTFNGMSAGAINGMGATNVRRDTIITQGAPIMRTGQTYASSYVNGQSLGSMGYMGSMENVGMTQGFIESRAIETIPVTTTVMDGISTTTAVPHYTVQDNLTGAHSYLNYPFGSDDIV